MERRKQAGVSLIELMLVLAIMVSIMVLGIRFYSQYRLQASKTVLAAKVDQLFQAMKFYYQANCRQALDNNAVAQSPGTLDPTVIGNNLTLALNITNNLVTPGFISDWQPLNVLVDNSAEPDQGYYVQFNRYQVANQDPTMNVVACTGNDRAPNSAAGTPSRCEGVAGTNVVGGAILQPPPGGQSKVMVWLAQVAIKLASTEEKDWQQAMLDLNAKCISSLSDKKVAPCETNPSAEGYLVWERPIFYYTPNVATGYDLFNNSVREFNMQYTNDGMATLSGVQTETGTPPASSWYNPLNYLCGG